MEAMQYAEGAVKEFLLFRGFTHTLQTFEAELASDVGNGFQVDRILDLLFMVYVPRFEADKLVELMAFLNKLFFASADVWYQSTVRKLDSSLKRYYIVHALQKGRPDRVLDFYERYGESLLRTGEDWHAWFALPYMKSPSTDPRFQVYFTKEWLDTLILSLRNFLCEVFDSIQLPALLKFRSERSKNASLTEEVEQLQTENSLLRDSLKAKDAEIFNLERSLLDSAPSKSIDSRRLASEESLISLTKQPSKISAVGSQEAEIEAESEVMALQESARVLASLDDKLPDASSPRIRRPSKLNQTTRASSVETISEEFGRTMSGGFADALERQSDMSHVAVEFQETFSGHTSPITRCRFSATGANISSASMDGTVRIWAPDNAAATSRNATIYTGAEIMSLEWEYKSDRLVPSLAAHALYNNIGIKILLRPVLLLGTAERGIKAWNVEAKRVVCDLSTEAAFPRVLDLKCSPTDPVFCCAAASQTSRAPEGVYGLGFGSLTIWNMRTWKSMSSLPLGEDPPVVTSVCFNHNGKIVAAGATDGMIRLFDMKGNLPITGWPAHDGCAVSCVRFGHDQASIFSLGADGKVLEWSLHNQGHILQSRNASEYCSLGDGILPRHELAIDSGGHNLLLSSNLTTAPLYQWEGSRRTLKTLEHNAAITSVDWHPSLPMYLTGSADRSVRVTSIA